MMAELEPKKHTDEAPEEEQAPKKTIRHYIILSVLFKVMMSTVLCSCIETEYARKTLEKEYNINTSVPEHFSNCGYDNVTLNQEEDYKTVRKLSARWQVVFLSAEAVPTLIAQLVYPSLTDIYGRKFLVILSTAATCLKGLVLALTAQFEGSLWFLFASRIVTGMAGSSLGIVVAAFTMASDLTPSGKQRTSQILMIECIMIMAAGIGVFTANFLQHNMEMGFFGMAMMATANCAVALLMTFCILETHLKENRLPHQSLLKSIQRSGRLYIQSKINRSSGKKVVFILLILAFVFASLCTINRLTLQQLYVLSDPFCWGYVHSGLYYMIRSQVLCITGIIAMKLLMRWLSLEMIAIIAALSTISSDIIQAFASTVTIYMAPVVSMLSILVIPVIRGLMSPMVPQNQQGALYGSMTFLQVVCAWFAFVTQTLIFYASTSFMKGFVYLTLALFSTITMVLMIAVRSLKTKANCNDDGFGQVETDFTDTRGNVMEDSAAKMMGKEKEAKV